MVASVLHIPQVISLGDVTKNQIQNPLNDSSVLYQDHQAPEVSLVQGKDYILIHSTGDKYLVCHLELRRLEKFGYPWQCASC